MQNNFSHPFTKALVEYRQFRKTMTVQASNIAANTFKDNFRRGGYESDSGGTTKWKPRKKNKTKRDVTRAILVKSGRLRRGIRAVPTHNYARVINNVPYAKKHNEGFKGIENVKAHVRYSWTKSKVKIGKNTKVINKRTGHTLVKAHTRKANTPARPFMRTTKPLVDRINYMVQSNLKKIFK